MENLLLNLHFFVLTIFRPPSTALTPTTHYERMLDMFGYSGYFADNIPDLQKSLKEALAVPDRPTIINVAINPYAGRKVQKFNWLTESKL